MAVSSLIADETNPVRYRDDEVQRAQAFVERYPDRALPIVVSSSGRVLIGHIFVEAARLQGVDHLWVIRQDLLGKAEELRFLSLAPSCSRRGTGTSLLWMRRSGRSSRIADFSQAFLGFAPGELDRVRGLAAVAGTPITCPTCRTGRSPASVRSD